MTTKIIKPAKPEHLVENFLFKHIKMYIKILGKFRYAENLEQAKAWQWQ